MEQENKSITTEATLMTVNEKPETSTEPSNSDIVKASSKNESGLSLIESLSTEQYDVLTNVLAKNCTKQELAYFLLHCQAIGLSPWKKQVYAIKRGGALTIQTSIDGLRAIAAKSGKFKGRTPIEWYGVIDGKRQWTDVWVEKQNPLACRVGVYHADFIEPMVAVGTWDTYCQMYNGKPSGFWVNGGAHMLAKCVEALAIRMAFPDLGGMYIKEEMDQMENQPRDITPQNQYASGQYTPVLNTLKERQKKQTTPPDYLDVAVIPEADPFGFAETETMQTDETEKARLKKAIGSIMKSKGLNRNDVIRVSQRLFGASIQSSDQLNNSQLTSLVEALEDYEEEIA